MTGERKGRGNMHVPLPGVVRDPATNLDQTTNQRLDRSLNLLTRDDVLGEEGIHIFFNPIIPISSDPVTRPIAPGASGSWISEGPYQDRNPATNEEPSI